MAGGVGSRMESTQEKPLIQLDGKPMIKHVIESLNKLDSIEKIFVATSSKTPKTSKFIEDIGLEVVETSGSGYHPDMKEAIEKIGDETVLVISSDLPLVKKSDLEKIIRKFKKFEKPALSTFIELKNSDFEFRAEESFEMDGREVAPAGINLIEGRKIDESYIEQKNLILSRSEIGLNVNSKNDLRRAERILSER
ncbi:hypothetical protein AKJ52_02105 [candidate division MSBL1 archaeon SCGC-AAA382C18]|uniref:MobA-like NTP transferase domain-containing protein n=1 Tax=candidate division MSBL1 archaeon SCGC-AAA382C18 TaxID=1698281 RepID=A0A133VJD9_9EURY|nr:hypothetical protein AKJ52_02105 [candidate division MSBL1 archaeon SCGC-AAA382C18]